MAREIKAKEPTVKEMQRLIYQVNKRLYRLEKHGAHVYNPAYENALAIISRGEKKQNKVRLTVSKNENRLREQYYKALEITGGGNYEELTVTHIREEIKRNKLETAGKNREETFSNRYGIDNIDYAMYNLFKTREYKQLKDAFGSDVAVKVLAPAVNAGLGTSQLKTMIREFLKESQDQDRFYVDKLQGIVNKYAERYT